MRLYHRTPEGDTILEEGFRDAEGTYGYSRLSAGVWLADTTLTQHEGAKGDDVLVIDLPEEVVARYERTGGQSGYREFQVPADVVNRYPIERLWRCDDCCGDDMDPNECPPGKALVQLEKPTGWLRQRGRNAFGERMTVTLCDECAETKHEKLYELFTPNEPAVAEHRSGACSAGVWGGELEVIALCTNGAM